MKQLKHLGWIVLSILFLVASSLISAEVAILDLRKESEWQLKEVDTAGAELDRVTVQVERTRAVATPQRADRALVHVRLSLQGAEDARQAWVDCRLTLHDDQDRKWLPMETENTDGAIKAVAADRMNNGRCNPVPYDAPRDGSAILSDQVFLVPVDTLGQLTLHVSGYGTRPRALAIRIEPDLTVLN